MKRIAFSLMVLALLSVGVAEEALAQTCPSISGPHSWGPRYWFDYAIAPGCYNTSGVSSITSSCGFGAWSLGNSSASYSFTVGSQVLDATKWTASTRIYFNDTNNSNGNWVYFAVNVTHPNTTVTQYQIVSWSGTDGDITGCALSSGTFTANTGDVVEVLVLAQAAVGSPTISVEYPSIINEQ